MYPSHSPEEYEDWPQSGGGEPPFRGRLYNKPPKVGRRMAKNSFFIRASLNAGDTGAFAETEIDLGSYTNLGSSKPEVLRIHNVQVALTDSSGLMCNVNADKIAEFAYQITTQSQSGIVLINDDSFVAGGRGAVRNPDSSDTTAGSQSHTAQLLPQDFTQGYVVAVPSLFLGGVGGSNYTEDLFVTVMMECTTEPMSKANAVALAISQQ